MHRMEDENCRLKNGRRPSKLPSLALLVLRWLPQESFSLDQISGSASRAEMGFDTRLAKKTKASKDQSVPESSAPSSSSSRLVYDGEGDVIPL